LGVFQSLGLACPLLITSFTTDVKETVDLPEVPARKSSKRFTIETVASKVAGDAHPSLHQTSKDDIERRIRDANNVWRLNYDESGVGERRSDEAASKRASFSPQEKWETIYEDPDMSEDLRLSRTSDTARRRADQVSML
jgi:hypothetical protein